MNRMTKGLIAGLVLVAGVALAEEASTNPDAIAREELMMLIGKNTKVLGDMAGGKTAFDAAAAEAARSALVAAAADIPAKFEGQGSDGGSEARPEIWTNWDDFLIKAKALETAAAGLDATSLEGVQAGMGTIGGACKGCHMSYRSM